MISLSAFTLIGGHKWLQVGSDEIWVQDVWSYKRVTELNLTCFLDVAVDWIKCSQHIWLEAKLSGKGPAWKALLFRAPAVQPPSSPPHPISWKPKSLPVLGLFWFGNLLRYRSLSKDLYEVWHGISLVFSYRMKPECFMLCYCIEKENESSWTLVLTWQWVQPLLIPWLTIIN